MVYRCKNDLPLTGKGEKMKNTFKKLTLGCMSGILLASMTLPVLAQNYGNSDNGYYDDNDYSYSPPAQKQAYKQNYAPQKQNYNLPPLKGHVVVVPAGTMISGVTANRTLSSKNLRTGDRVSVMLNAPFYYGNSLALPAGTNISGTVVTASAAGRAEKNGKLMIVFNQAITPSGQQLGFSGKIATDDGSGLLKGGTAMGRATSVAKDTAVGAGAGALAGLIGSAVSGGKTGRGAAIGTAIGGGIGLGKSVIDKGKDVVISAGDPLDIILDSDLRAGGEQGGGQSLPSMNDYGY
jgi:hypothetical protein